MMKKPEGTISVGGAILPLRGNEHPGVMAS
jgi:hypothetical protein